jgi:hypothetical protein
MKRAVLIAIAVLATLGATPAAARPLRLHGRTISLTLHLPRWCHSHRRCVRQHHTALRQPEHSKPPRAESSSPPPPTTTPVLEIGKVPGCRTGASPTAYLQHYQAVLRVILNPGNYQLGGIACARDAVAAGYRLHLVIQWWNPWTIAQVQTFFRTILAQLGPYAWAISIGNEQELSAGGPGITGQAYSIVWKAVEPLVAAAAPNAIRVAGEISPWGLHHLQAAYNSGLPGVQAVSAHPYKLKGAFAIPDFISWAQSKHLPYWFDEGYLMPGVWMPSWTSGPDALPGASVVGGWVSWTGSWTPPTH